MVCKKGTSPDAASTPHNSDKPSFQSSKDLDPNFKADNRFQEGKEASVHQAIPATFKSHRDEVGNKDQNSLSAQLPDTGVQKNNQLALIALGTGLIFTFRTSSFKRKKILKIIVLFLFIGRGMVPHDC